MFTAKTLGLHSILAAAAVAMVAPRAHGQEAEASVSTADLEGGSDDQGGALLLAGKVGGIASFNGLSPFVAGGVELGYAFAPLNRAFGAYLGAEYTAPKREGSLTEDTNPDRVPGGAYDWELRQKQLTLQPTFLFRMSMISEAVVPYIGVGPRIYFLESVVRGSSGGQKFADTTERSTKIGLGLPVGAEISLGPGGILAEFLFQWAPIDHEATGDSNLGAASLFLGYRALL